MVEQAFTLPVSKGLQTPRIRTISIFSSSAKKVWARTSRGSKQRIEGAASTALASSFVRGMRQAYTKERYTSAQKLRQAL